MNPVRLWQRWVAFLSTREDGASLAAARFISGSTIAWNLFEMATSGAAWEAWVDVSSGGARTAYCPLLMSVGGCSHRNVHALIALGCLGGVLMAIGFATRLSTAVTWYSFLTLTSMNYLAGGSADDLLLNGLFVLMLSGCGRTLSVDHWLRRRKDPAAPSDAPAWPRWVLIFQIVTVYWTTGLQKVSASWWPPPFGTLDAIWYILQQPTWIRFPTLEWATPLFRLTQVASLGTWLLENSAPLLLVAFWYRFTRERPGKLRAFFNAPLRPLRRWLGPAVDRLDYRLCFLAAGFSMHLGIFLLMEVGPFFNSVLVCYACCITPAEWRAAFAWVRGKLRPAPASASTATP